MALSLIFFFSLCITLCFAGNVSYDSRSLIINGERKLLISAAIHYPRSVPAVSVTFLQLGFLFSWFLLKKMLENNMGKWKGCMFTFGICLTGDFLNWVWRVLL